MTQFASLTPRFAIIGAGPSGVFAAERLLALFPAACIDIFEKNPVPMGLIRHGIAPDHPAAKRAETVLDKILADSRIRLFTNVRVGVGRGASSHADQQGDLTLSELRASYTAVVVATGASHSKQIRIPGSQASNFVGSSDFTGWYNSDPSASNGWDLTTPIVAVIGGGNVALDVARMLLRSPEDLTATDVAPSVIDRYTHSAVTEVHVFVRRGPGQAKWSTQELRDLAALPNTTLNFDDRDFTQFHDECEQPGMPVPDREQKAIVRAMERLNKRTRSNEKIDPDLPTDLSVQAEHRIVSAQDRQVYFHFYSQPVEVPVDEDGEVQGLITEHTHVTSEGKAVADADTHHMWHLSAIYTAIGYQPALLGPLPADPTTGGLRTRDCRVIGPDSLPLAGVYATGWARRGARGLVPETRTDARLLAQAISEDISSGVLSVPSEASSGESSNESAGVASGEPSEGTHFDPAGVLRSRGVRFGDYAGWKRVEEAEKQLGAESGRKIAKIADAATLIRLADASPTEN